MHMLCLEVWTKIYHLMGVAGGCWSQTSQLDRVKNSKKVKDE